MRLPNQTRFSATRKPAQRAGMHLYGLAGTPETCWLQLILSEKNLPQARFQAVNLHRPPEDLLAVNPGLRLPALIDRETPVVSAGIIAAYLDERFPHPPLMPPEPAHRARVRLLLDLMLGTVFPQLQTSRPDTLGHLLDLADLIGPRSRLMGLDYHLGDCAAAVWLLHPSIRLDALPAPAAERLHGYVRRLRARPAVESTLI